MIPGSELRKLRLIEAERFKSYIDRIDLWLNDTRELHYSTNNADHHPCYELRGQQTSVWCVAASVQMVLDFYRYNYLQTTSRLRARPRDARQPQRPPIRQRAAGRGHARGASPPMHSTRA